MNNLKIKGIAFFLVFFTSIVGINILCVQNDIGYMENEEFFFLTKEEAFSYLNEDIYDVLFCEKFDNLEICLIYNNYIRIIALEESQKGVKIKKYSEKLSKYNWEKNKIPFIVSFEHNGNLMNVIIQHDAMRPIADLNRIGLENNYSLYYYIE
jgi:hypothetical protein